MGGAGKSAFTTNASCCYPGTVEWTNTTPEAVPKVEAEGDCIRRFIHLIPKPLRAPIEGENRILPVISMLNECKEHGAKIILLALHGGWLTYIVHRVALA